MMRHIILLLILSIAGLSACNRNQDDDALEAISQAQEAQESLGQEEIFARDMIVELTEIIEGKRDDGEAIDVQVERWLKENGNALSNNAHVLQARLESMTDPERARYEEIFNVFMRPTLDAWKAAQESLKENDPRTHAHVRRALKMVMSGKAKSKPANMPEPEDAPDVGEDID